MSILVYFIDRSLTYRKLPVSLGIYVNGDYFKCPQDNDTYCGLNLSNLNNYENRNKIQTNSDLTEKHVLLKNDITKTSGFY